MMDPAFQSLHEYLHLITEIKKTMRREHEKRRLPDGVDPPPQTFSLEGFVLHFGHSCHFGEPWKDGTTAKACFQMAYEIATKNPEWLYVEGFACPNLPQDIHYPVHHAWVAHRDSPTRAVEVSWEDGGLSYLGIAFKTSYVRECVRLADRRWFGAIDTWWMDETLLNGMRSLENVDGWPKEKPAPVARAARKKKKDEPPPPPPRKGFYYR